MSERPFAVVCAAIAVSVVAVYAQVADHAFLDFDDAFYVTANGKLQEGLTPANLAWAFFTTDAFIWHPLTWLSYLVDFELYGIESARGWLLTNVAWHFAGSLALLAALSSLTGRFWPSVFVAALFALHPIQAEPVAWVSARKEVLAGFFFMLTLWGYARYVRRRDGRSYALVMALMFLCLAAKGSQVSLPFLLLLLDYWPLRRLRLGPDAGGETLASLVVEKLPLLALSLAAIGYQYAAVSNAYNPWNTDPAFFDRVQNGIMVYVATLGRLFWPTGLAIVYPTPLQMGLPPAGAVQVGVAFAGLVGATALAAAAGQRRGYWIVGWLWFVGMLLPMVNLLPSGLRVMHDRYTYVPMVGLALRVSFGVADGLKWIRAPRSLVAGGAAAVLAVCAFLAWQQAGVWRDSLTLFDHALAVTERNAIVRFFRGKTLVQSGDVDGARHEYESALDIHPDYPGANNNLGKLLLEQGRGAVAVPYFQRALDARPGWTEATTNLANALWESGERERAMATFEAAVASAPESADARYWLATAQLREGRRAAAVDGYRAALRLDPRHPGARLALDRLSGTNP